VNIIRIKCWLVHEFRKSNSFDIVSIKARLKNSPPIPVVMYQNLHDKKSTTAKLKRNTILPHKGMESQANTGLQKRLFCCSTETKCLPRLE